MRTRVLITAAVGAVVTVLVASAGIAPAQESRPPEREQGGDNPGGPGGPGGEQRRGGGGRFGGPGGPGGMGGGDRPIVKQFDKDADGRLNTDERAAARDFVKKNPGGRGGFGGGGPGGRGGFGPGGMVAQQVLSQGDADKNEKLSRAEMVAVAGAWFDELDTDKAQKLSEDQFADRIGSLLPMQGGAAGGGSGGPVFQPGGGGGGPGGGGPGGGGFGGRGGFSPGRMLGPVLFEAADADKDKSLTRDELATRFGTWFDAWDADKDAALTDIELRDGFNAALPRPNFGGRGGGPGGGGPGGGRGNQEPAKPGPRVAQADVKPVNASVPLYDSATLRTLFFDFDAADWEAELGDFRDTDVEVPAKLTVDGTELPNVGIRFRGMSSLGMVPEGRKRSLNVTVDLADKKQRLLGYKTLNLLNAHEDPTFLHTVLYFDVARNYIPAPKANFAKVVINGESWGVYTNAQQFNKEFIKEWFSNNDGARWKVRGSPGGRGGLEYLGEDPEPYKAIYGIKSPDVPQAWKDLARLCRVLNQTPPDQLEAALESILDVDGALWFLALENVFINGDGYWVRASDYCIYQETSGRFHIIPHDANETFGPGGGPGFGPGGPGGGGGFGGRQGGGRSGPGGGGGAGDVATRGPRDGGPTTRPMGGGGGGRGGLELDPLVGLDDSTKPLRSRLLAVPALRERYLAHVKTLAEQWLDWEKLGPVVARYRDLIGEEVAADTRKLESTEAFAAALSPGDAQPAAAAEPAQPFGRSQMSLRQFAQRRRDYLLKYPAIAALKSPQPSSGDRPKAD